MRCTKCGKQSDDCWTIENIGTKDWLPEDFKWFGDGPNCEECIKEHFKPKAL